MSKKLSVEQAQERQALLAGLSVTGISFAQVSTILLQEIKQLPAQTYNAVLGAVQNTGKTGLVCLDEYIKATVEGDVKKMQQVREKQFLSDVKLINALMYNDASHIVAKMQQEAQKHTNPDKNGHHFNMFQAVLPNAVYNPNDIRLLKENGYDFNKTHLIEGKKTDFVEYNLDEMQKNNLAFEKTVKLLSDELRLILPEKQELDMHKERLKAEQKKALQKDKQKIEAELEKIETRSNVITKKARQLQNEALSYSADFVWSYYRLMGAEAENVLSPENVQKIKSADILNQVEQMAQNLEVFTSMTNALSHVDRADKKEEKHTNKTLAASANNEEAFNEEKISKPVLKSQINEGLISQTALSLKVKEGAKN